MSPDAPDFDTNDLVTAVVQDVTTRDVLMVAHMNREAWDQTLSSREATFYSRSRQQIWRKGETSGNRMHIEDIAIDCDGDAVLLSVHPDGPACHTGQRTCFSRSPSTG